MIFNEPAYFALIALAALAFRNLPGKAKPWWLFAAGVLFYAYFSPAFVGILLVEVIAVYALGLVVRKNRRGARIAFAAGLVVTVGMLVAYKYTGLLTRTLTGAGVHGLPTFEDIRLPLAISFFTFEFVHYLADARKGTLPEHGASDFLAFAMFVPTMIAGPIKRFQGFSAQLREMRATPEDVAEGTTRMLVGLAKKIVLADTLTLWLDPISSRSAMGNATRLEIVIALVAYSFRIYFDFSGYSDIAIGSARLFGIRVPENFSWPYLKTNIAEFWRSWHMSLMSWIRDYIYIPLGGSRVPTPQQLGNLVIAFAVSGLWHGAAWNFLGWGLYHGTLVAGHRLYQKQLKPRVKLRLPGMNHRVGLRVWSGLGALAGGLLTFSLVTLGWGLFAMPFSRFAYLLSRLAKGIM